MNVVARRPHENATRAFFGTYLRSAHVCRCDKYLIQCWMNSLLPGFIGRKPSNGPLAQEDIGHPTAFCTRRYGNHPEILLMDKSCTALNSVFLPSFSLVQLECPNSCTTSSEASHGVAPTLNEGFLRGCIEYAVRWCGILSINSMLQ